MAKKKAKKQASAQSHQHVVTNVKPLTRSGQSAADDTTDDLFDLSDPEVFRRAFIASEILNRKY